MYFDFQKKIYSQNWSEFSISEIQSLQSFDKFLEYDLQKLGIQFIFKATDEYTKAKAALFARHPVMIEWEKNESHAFYVARLNIDHGWLIDFFGGGYDMPIKDYFNGHDSTLLK